MLILHTHQIHKSPWFTNMDYLPSCPADTTAQTQGSCYSQDNLADQQTHTLHTGLGKIQTFILYQQPASGSRSVTHEPTLAPHMEPFTNLTHASSPYLLLWEYTSLPLDWLGLEDPPLILVADARIPLDRCPVGDLNVTFASPLFNLNS